jgi:hypothetical protein
MKHATCGDRFHGRGTVIHAHVEIERVFHMRTKSARWRACPIYSCVICSSRAWFVFSSAAKSGEELTHLEIDGAILYLDYGVSSELIIVRVKVVRCGASPTVLEVAPIHVVVIYEAAVQD